MNKQKQHRYAGNRRQPRDTGRDAVRHIECHDGEGIGSAFQAGQEFIKCQHGLACAGEHPIERIIESEIVLHSPARTSRRRARTRCGRSSILPSSVSTPESGLFSKVATTRLAQSISGALGVKTSWMTATWSGWMAILPP